MSSHSKLPETTTEKLDHGSFAQKAHDLLNGTVTDLHLTPEENRRLVRKIDICLLPIMACAYLFQFLDKTSLTYASITGIRTDLHLSGLQYSWAGSIYYFGYLIASYPVSVLFVRFPIAKIIAASLFIWGSILMLTAACSNPAGLLTCRFFLGVAEAAIAPGLTTLIAMWYTRDEQPLRQGAWFLGNTTAGFFGGLVGYGVGHITTIRPWKAIFLVFGACTVTFSLVVWAVLPDSPLNARFLSKEDRAKAILRVQDNMTTIKADKWKKEQVIEALCDPTAWLLVLIEMSACVPNNGLVTFGSIIIEGFGYSTLKTMLLNMVQSAYQLVFVVICVVGSTYLPNSRTWFMAGCMAISVVGSVVVRQVDPANKVARLNGLGLLVAFSGPFPLVMAMMSSNIGGFTKKTTVSAMVFMAYCVGNIIGPYLFFAREAPAYPSGFLSMIICFCISCLACLALRFHLVRQNKIRDQQQAGVTDIDLNLLDQTDKQIPQFRYTY
ncbi:hypothetical protein TD95_001495 [Thielaviopsis punctulata]|uniref:Major facilitator superfamily (MFS) profile domain-containing protein n=1 Tax=Thielaviopsis punctulata TaxID=72032 RepID=A0A0F4ZI63_9PEZI|nr:hypothetical protein TD95_001495 [Thielaviopsis punctulata]